MSTVSSVGRQEPCWPLPVTAESTRWLLENAAVVDHRQVGCLERSVSAQAPRRYGRSVAEIDVARSRS